MAMLLPRKITSERSHLLHDIAATRLIEQRVQATRPDPSLMQRAGFATAKLAMALAPHAKTIWIACGPGNNGGDGFEAARVLHAFGKTVILTWTGHRTANAQQPKDAHQARVRAEAAGLHISDEPPAQFDLAIDALLGIGGALKTAHANSALMADWLRRMDAAMHHGVPVLCVDVPTGLDADSGVMRGLDDSPSRPLQPSNTPKLRHTLSLLTVKPGLFTADGRDWAGQVWFDDLGVSGQTDALPCAVLQGQDVLAGTGEHGLHASHKGSYGDVAVLGGETFWADATRGGGSSSMAGAAQLAARAALHAGAGRVYVALLGAGGPLNDALQPELMFRPPEALDLTQVLVCGCGGGKAIAHYLPLVLSSASRLVLDADALNAIAVDEQLRILLAARAERGFSTVITPHPLEAARLLKTSTADVQANRLNAAQSLAQHFGCVVLLKGSGSIVAAPGQTTVINHSGNARLATAGTGDVLAGLIGARLARGADAWTAARQGCFQHGLLADQWREYGQPDTSALTASRLAERLRP